MTHPTGIRYEIHLRGHPPPEVLQRLGDAIQVEAPPETVLLTHVIDQEGLDDLISRLEGLGLELLELRRTATSQHGSEQGSP
jgi:hypothetical protein